MNIGDRIDLDALLARKPLAWWKVAVLIARQLDESDEPVPDWEDLEMFAYRLISQHPELFEELAVDPFALTERVIECLETGTTLPPAEAFTMAQQQTREGSGFEPGHPRFRAYVMQWACWNLSRLRADGQFFLSGRDAGKELGIGHEQASALLRAAVARKRIRIVRKGYTGRATEYQWIGPEHGPTSAMP